MIYSLTPFIFLLLFVLIALIIWRNNKKNISSGTVPQHMTRGLKIDCSKDYEENIYIWDFITDNKKIDFRKAKEQFVHELVRWSGLDSLPKGSRFLMWGVV